MASIQYVTVTNLTQSVVFQSKNTTDVVEYSGVISGIVTYQEALQYFDVNSYNAAVQQADPTVGAASLNNYFLIKINNGSGQIATYAFANEWISVGSFSVVDNTVIVNIAVYDAPANDHNQIITLLQANGFRAVITSVSS